LASNRFLCPFVSITQGVPKVLTWFWEVISQEALGLQKWHGHQKMRLILKFCLVFETHQKSKFFRELWLMYEKKVFWQIFAPSHSLDNYLSKFSRWCHANLRDYGNVIDANTFVSSLSYVWFKKQNI
jgi:hypothetical protein